MRSSPDCSLKALPHYDAIPPECDAFALLDKTSAAIPNQETAAAIAAASAAMCSVPGTTPDSLARDSVLKLVSHVARHRRLPRSGKRSKQSTSVEVPIAISRQSSLVELSLRAGVLTLRSSASGFPTLCGQPWSGRISESVLPSEDLFAPDAVGRPVPQGSCAVLAGKNLHMRPDVRSHSMLIFVDEARWAPRLSDENRSGQATSNRGRRESRAVNGSGYPHMVRILGAEQSAALLAGQVPSWLVGGEHGGSEAPRQPASHLLLRLSSAEQLHRFGPLSAMLPHHKALMSDTTALARYRTALLKAAGAAYSHSTSSHSTASEVGVTCPPGLGTALLVGSLLCSRMHVFGLGAAGQAALCDGPAAQDDCRLFRTLSDAGLLCLQE